MTKKYSKFNTSGLYFLKLPSLNHIHPRLSIDIKSVSKFPYNLKYSFIPYNFSFDLNEFFYKKMFNNQ